MYLTSQLTHVWVDISSAIDYQAPALVHFFDPHLRIWTPCRIFYLLLACPIETSIFVCLCTSVHVWGCSSASKANAHTFSCMGRLETTSDVILHELSTLFLETGSFAVIGNLGNTGWSLSIRSACLGFPSAGIMSRCYDV